MNQALTDWSERVLSALGNGLVQGMFVAAVVWLVLRVPRTANAATRHAVQFVALVLVVALPVIDFVREDARGSSEAGGRWVPGGAAEPAEVRGGPIDVPQAGAADGAVEEARVSTGSESRPIEPGVANPDPVRAVAEESKDENAPGVAPVLTSTGPEAGESRPPEGWLSIPVGGRWELPMPSELVLLVGLGWGALALIRLCVLAGQCAALRRMKARGTAAPERVEAMFRALLESTGTTRSAVLRVVPGVGSPMVVGFCRPAILVPAEVSEAEGVDWERMLRHELAHLRRGDDWTNLFQQAAKAVLFFHPAVWWLSRRLTVDREIACDDHVLSATGSPRAYALFLTEFARRTRGPAWVAAPGAWSNPSQLTERITMLLDTRRNASPRLAPVRAGVWTATVLLVALFGLYVSPRMALADTGADAVNAADDVTEVTAPKEKPEEQTVTVTSSIPKPSPSAVIAPAPQPEPAPAALPEPPVPGAEVAVLASPALPPVPPADPSSDKTSKRARLARSSGSASRVLVAPSVPGKPKVSVVADGKVLTSSSSSGGADVTVTVTGSDSGESMERRLQRLEKLVADLQRNNGRSAGASADVYAPKPPRAKTTSDGEPGQFRYDVMTKVLSEVNQAVAQAAREAERAVRDAEKTARQSLEAGGKHGPDVDATKRPEEAVKAERDARRREIEVQRKVLQKQISSLESQLGRLEGQLDRLGDHMEERVDMAEKALAREQARMERQKAQTLKKRAESERRHAEMEAEAATASSKDAVVEKKHEHEREERKEKTKDNTGDKGPDGNQKF